MKRCYEVSAITEPVVHSLVGAEMGSHCAKELPVQSRNSLLIQRVASVLKVV